MHFASYSHLRQFYHIEAVRVSALLCDSLDMSLSV